MSFRWRGRILGIKKRLPVGSRTKNSTRCGRRIRITNSVSFVMLVCNNSNQIDLTKDRNSLPSDTHSNRKSVISKDCWTILVIVNDF